ncbi:hypothetical protein IWQ60_009587 [Tieghemiomyces parasiticus]|uniref:RING-type domain-containing protein n=1 Tax=Tieghemiomyces parasiticus TaxID=78921 RepID=A0A9W8DJN7_9FUNG|nr:hypothetical protein IWQ60_009587 [Tieghemiomyces parasiticus]
MSSSAAGDGVIDLTADDDDDSQVVAESFRVRGTPLLRPPRFDMDEDDLILVAEHRHQPDLEGLRPVTRSYSSGAASTATSRRPGQRWTPPSSSQQQPQPPQSARASGGSGGGGAGPLRLNYWLRQGNGIRPNSIIARSLEQPDHHPQDLSYQPPNSHHSTRAHPERTMRQTARSVRYRTRAVAADRPRTAASAFTSASSFLDNFFRLGHSPARPSSRRVAHAGLLARELLPMESEDVDPDYDPDAPYVSDDQEFDHDNLGLDDVDSQGEDMMMNPLDFEGGLNQLATADGSFALWDGPEGYPHGYPTDLNGDPSQGPDHIASHQAYSEFFNLVYPPPPSELHGHQPRRGGQHQHPHGMPRGSRILLNLSAIFDPNARPEDIDPRLRPAQPRSPLPAIKLTVAQQRLAENSPVFTRTVPELNREGLLASCSTVNGPADLPMAAATPAASSAYATSSLANGKGQAKPSDPLPPSTTTMAPPPLDSTTMTADAEAAAAHVIVCPKCVTVIRDVFATTCGHIVCTDCAANFGETFSCPSCKRRTKKATMFRLFF